MSDVIVNLRLPRNLLGTLDAPGKQIPEQVLELLALELFRQERISAGKGAELLGITKWDFIQLLNCHSIDYFTQSPKELEAEVTEVEALIGRSHE